MRLLGLIASTIFVVPFARLRMRCLQTWFLRSFKPRIHPLHRRLLIPPEVLHSLRWWSSPQHLSVGLPFRMPEPLVVLAMDASCWGWGAQLGTLQAQGRWSGTEQALHINCLEMLAVTKGMHSFLPVLAGRTVFVLTDNVATVFYINRQGGTQSRKL